MTNDTSYRKQGRAVFLAAIMVLSMVAGAAAFAGSAAAEHDSGATEVDVEGELDDSSRWSGEVLNITGFGPGELVEIEHQDSSEFEQINATDGTIEFDTEGWSAGEIDVSDGEGANATFTLREQNINTFEFGTDSIVTGTTDLSIESNRADYNVLVSAEGLSGEDLDTIFEGNLVETTSHTDGDTVIVEGEGDVEADFTDIAADDYTFEGEVVDTGVTATTNITVNEGADQSATFDSDSYSGVVGDVVDVDMTTSGEPDHVYVNVTDDNGYYTGTVNITPTADAYEDGFTLSWNTYNASNETADYGFSADNADVEDVVNTDGAAIEADNLANSATSYEFESYTKDPTDESTDFSDVAAVSLSERSTDGVTIWTAPSSYDHDGDSEEILNASTETSTIAQEDLLIAQVEANGIYGYMNSTPSAFSDVGGLELSFNQVSTAGPYSSDDNATIADVGNENATIVTQPDEGQFYVMVDTSVIEGLEYDEEWNAEFSVTTDNPFVESENENVNDTFTYEERNVEFTGNISDDVLTVPASSDTAITGTTNVAPGTQVDARMNFPLDFATADGEVFENGTFSAEANLSARDSGTEFETRVRVPSSDTEQTISSVIGAAEDDGEDEPSGSAAFEISATPPSDVVAGDDASLAYMFSNTGDASGTVEYTVTVGGEEVDSNSTEIDSGSSTASMSVPVPTDSAGDVAWEITTQNSSDSGTISVSEAPTDGDTDDGDTDDSDTGDSDTGDSDSDDGDGGGQPGFGLVVALFALIGAALLALRRQN